MDLHSKIVVSVILCWLILGLLRSFFARKLGAGQTLFWLCTLAGAETLTLFPQLVDCISPFWGNLVPVSWITFVGLVLLIFYLLQLTVQINRFDRIAELSRYVATLEKRVRELEGGPGTNREPRPDSI